MLTAKLNALAASEQARLAGQAALAQSEQARSASDKALADMAQALADRLRTGQAQTLHRQLSRRLGHLNPSIQAQIDTADSTQIEAWLDRVVEASSAEDIFKLTV